MTDLWLAARRLLGRWQGTATGRPGVGQQWLVYRETLDSRFILGTNKIRWAEVPDAPAFTHEDLTVLSLDRQTGELRLRGFYSEGLVHDYRCVEASADGTRLVFEAGQVEGGPAGMRARETIELFGADGMVRSFELAMPGAAFEPYTREELRRTAG